MGNGGGGRPFIQVKHVVGGWPNQIIINYIIQQTILDKLRFKKNTFMMSLKYLNFGPPLPTNSWIRHCKLMELSFRIYQSLLIFVDKVLAQAAMVMVAIMSSICHNHVNWPGNGF